MSHTSLTVTMQRAYTIFTTVFFLLLILSVFLIEGSYRFYLLAAWSLFALFSAQYFFVRQGRSEQPPLIKFAIVLAVLFASNLIFSTNIATTLEKALFYVVALAVFVAFALIPKERFKPIVFFYLLSMTSLLLNTFVLFFTFFPLPPDLFPPMNMLVRIFGHNYYVAYSLLVLPVFWWQFLFAQEQRTVLSVRASRTLAMLLIVSSYLIMIFSIARWSMLVGFVQLLCIFWLNKAALVSLLHNQLAYTVIKAFLLALFVLVVVFSLLPVFATDQRTCPLRFTYKELCKPFLKNDRLQYWQKALWVWQSRPWFGTGLKTFAFASRQFVLEDYNFSSYAHNIFLLNLAEGGIVTGVPFICFVLVLLSRLGVIAKRSQASWQRFLLVAVLASLTNAMFDLTWNFFVIFTLTLVFAAIMLQTDQPSAKRGKMVHGYLVVVALCSTALCIAHMVAATLMQQGKKNTVFSVFPFFDQFVRRMVHEQKLSAAEFAKLYPIYHGDHDFIYGFSKITGLDPKQRVALLLELSRIDPLFFIDVLKLSTIPPDQAAPLADAVVAVLQQHNMLDNIKLLDYWEQRNIAADMFTLANQAYLNGSATAAASLYLDARTLNPYIFSNLRPAFLNTSVINEADLDLLVQFLQHFQHFNPEELGDFYVYMNLYNQVLLHLFQHERLAEFGQLSQQLLQFLPNHAWFLRQDLQAMTDTAEEQARLERVYEMVPNLREL